MNLELLKQKNFALLMLGSLVSNMGTAMQDFALSLYVLKITGSGAKFASVLTAALIPELLLGPFMGVFADRFDRKKIIICLNFMSGITVGIAAIIFKVNGNLSMQHIYALVIILSIISLVFSPTMTAILPSIVKKEELLDANSLKTAIYSTGSIAAPLLAGLIFGLHGLFIVLILNAISFIVSAFSEVFMDIPKNKTKNSGFSSKMFMNDFITGLKFTASKHNILAIIFISLICNFAMGPLGDIVFPYVVKNVFKCSDLQYGMFQAIILSGMIIAPIICTLFLKKASYRKVISINIAIIGILIVILAVNASPSYTKLFKSSFIPYITFAFLALAMIILMTIVNIFTGTMFQKEVPINMMGRVGAAMNTLCMAVIPIGQIVFGNSLDSQPAYLVIFPAALILLFASFVYTKLTYVKEDKNIDAVAQ